MLFSIGQDPARDFKTLLKVRTDKKIHIHTNLLEKNDKNFKITNGSYFNIKINIMIQKSFYQKSFAIIIPLKMFFNQVDIV